MKRNYPPLALHPIWYKIQDSRPLQAVLPIIGLVAIAAAFWGAWELNVAVVHYFD